MSKQVFEVGKFYAITICGFDTRRIACLCVGMGKRIVKFKYINRALWGVYSFGEFRRWMSDDKCECHTSTSDVWHNIMNYAVQVKKPDNWDVVEAAQGKGE